MPRPSSRVLAPVVLLALASAPAAHERWVKHTLLSEFDRTLFEQPALANVGTLIGILVATAALAWWASRARASRPAGGRAATWAPAILGIAVGLGLILSALDGLFLAPDLVPAGALGPGLLVAEGVLGVLLLLGWKARWAGWAVLAAFLAVAAVRPFEPFDGAPITVLNLLDYFAVAGVGVYVGIVGRGAFAVDGSSRTPDPVRRARAVGALRVSLGATLVVLGAKKFLVPELPMGVVQNYADAIYEPLHAWTGVSPETYVFAASAIEVTAGLWILLGLLTRPVAVVLLALFTLTSAIFAGEVVGHLPLIGVVIVLIAEGAGAWSIADAIRLRRGGAARAGVPGAVASSGALLLSLLFVTGCGQAEAQPQVERTLADRIVVVGESGHVRFTVRGAPAPSDLNEFFELETELVDARTGGPLAGGELVVDATMPSHGHGMVVHPRTSPEGDGRFRTVGCKLHMHGAWSLSLEYAGAGVADRIEVPFDFSPPMGIRGRGGD